MIKDAILLASIFPGRTKPCIRFETVHSKIKLWSERGLPSVLQFYDNPSCYICIYIFIGSLKPKRHTQKTLLSSMNRKKTDRGGGRESSSLRPVPYCLTPFPRPSLHTYMTFLYIALSARQIRHREPIIYRHLQTVAIALTRSFVSPCQYA